MSSISTLHTSRSSLTVHRCQDDTLVDKCVRDVLTRVLEYPPIVVFGKPCRQRRCIGFFSNVAMGYAYSGQLAKSQPLTDNLATLMKHINTQFQSDFNGILVNVYNDGNDYISAHSDDERALGKSGVVAISVGAVRKFRIRDKTTKRIVCDIPMRPYTIIKMSGDFQKEFTHEVPKEKKVKGRRVSFTFRKHLRPSGAA